MLKDELRDKGYDYKYGLCIAQNTELARHPVKGTCDALNNGLQGLMFNKRFAAPDHGIVGETWLFYRQAKRPRVQAISLNIKH